MTVWGDAHVLSPVDASVTAPSLLFHPGFTETSRPLYIPMHESLRVAIATYGPPDTKG